MTKTYFVVTGIVMCNGKYLILKKAPDDYNYPEHWSFCSGFVKEFESAEDTCLREIKEETDLDVELIKEGTLIHKHDPRNGKNWVILPFLCKAKNTQIRLDHENTEYRWITKDEIKNYNFVPGLIKNLESVGFL